MRFLNDVIFSAVDASASQNSSAVESSYIVTASVQAVASSSAGTPTGTLKLQGSNDLPQNGAPSHWTDITSATVAVADDGTYAIQNIPICWQYIRLTYTRTSGSGAITARLKTIGY